jgi:hypothetical protein
MGPSSRPITLLLKKLNFIIYVSWTNIFVSKLGVISNKNFGLFHLLKNIIPMGYKIIGETPISLAYRIYCINPSPSNNPPL